MSHNQVAARHPLLAELLTSLPTPHRDASELRYGIQTTNLAKLSTSRSTSRLQSKRGGKRDAPISKRACPPYGAKWLLVSEQEPLVGSHIVTPRRGYLHHGIYVGGGRIVHYAGLAHGLRRGPVEEISIARFARGRAVWVRSDALSTFDRPEVIHRARSRVGEDGYRLLTNNCEHFCEWCLHGEHRSYQVERWLAHPRRKLHAAIRLIARWLSAAGGIGPRPARATDESDCWA